MYGFISFPSFTPIDRAERRRPKSERPRTVKSPTVAWQHRNLSALMMPKDTEMIEWVVILAICEHPRLPANSGPELHQAMEMLIEAVRLERGFLPRSLLRLSSCFLSIVSPISRLQLILVLAAATTGLAESSVHNVAPPTPCPLLPTALLAYGSTCQGVPEEATEVGSALVAVR